MTDPHRRNTRSFAVHVRTKREVDVYVAPCDARAVVTSATATATADVIDKVRTPAHARHEPSTH